MHCSDKWEPDVHFYGHSSCVFPKEGKGFPVITDVKPPHLSEESGISKTLVDLAF